MISLERVSKTFDGGVSHAVDDISLDVPTNSLTVLLGESGCGKTTSLKMINRLIEPDSGTIRIDGRDVTETDPTALRRGIGYVFQGIGLFPHMSVAQNVSVVPELLGWSKADIDARVREVLGLVELSDEDYSIRFPAELSGGQQQRVGVARALAARPKVLLMDEPFGAVDPLTRAQLQSELMRLRQQLELTVLMVTHDMTEALLLADQIAVMRDGRLIATGTPADLMRAPPHPYVADLLATPRRQADAIEQIAGAE
jgi:osmoprotectant transport system ATP-binding protein